VSEKRYTQVDIVYIYTHTHTKRKRKRKRVVLLRDSYIHIPLYYHIGKRTKETRYFYKTRNSFRFPFRSYKTANKKNIFSPLSCLKEITKEFVPSDCTFPLFFVLFFPTCHFPQEKTLHNNARGKNILCLSLSCVLLTPWRRIRRHLASSEVRRKDTRIKTHRATPIVPPPM
jgi:hypothetical protein